MLRRILSITTVLIAGLCSIAPAAINDPTTYYTLDSATTITDSGSGAHNGTPVNAPTSIAGKIGNAVSFNGSNQSVTVPAAATAVLSGGDFTIAFWMYQSAYTSYPAILDCPGGTQLFFSVKGNTNLYIQLNGSGGDNRTPSQAFALNAWQHVMIIRSGVNNTIYRNNVAVDSFTGGNLGTVGNASIAANVSGGGSWYTGAIDDFRIYSRALNSTDRADLYAYTGSSSTLFRRNLNLRSGSRSPMSFHQPTAVSPLEQFKTILRRIAA